MFSANTPSLPNVILRVRKVDERAPPGIWLGCQDGWFAMRDKVNRTCRGIRRSLEAVKYGRNSTWLIGKLSNPNGLKSSQTSERRDQNLATAPSCFFSEQMHRSIASSCFSWLSTNQSALMAVKPPVRINPLSEDNPAHSNQISSKHCTWAFQTWRYRKHFEALIWL